jgi:hypothetical protein
MIDPGKPEGIFFACLIKINIINTHPPIFILFWYKNRIGEPIWVVHFFKKSASNNLAISLSLLHILVFG